MEKEKSIKHLAIILDGNRRFAKRLMLEPWKGHEYGAEKIEKLFDWCRELGIKETTLYCFSIENFNRPKKEFRKVRSNERIEKNGIKIRFIGKKEMFDVELRELIGELERWTKDNKEFVFNFCMAYGGRQEIVNAVKKMIENREEINEENLKKNLCLESEPDLIIRTGGEKRLSNFLLFQSAYSEWVFLDKMWPEFEKQDLINAVWEFNKRERRFGR